MTDGELIAQRLADHGGARKVSSAPRLTFRPFARASSGALRAAGPTGGRLS